jgi:hypothetical protein
VGSVGAALDQVLERIGANAQFSRDPPELLGEYYT